MRQTRTQAGGPMIEKPGGARLPPVRGDSLIMLEVPVALNPVQAGAVLESPVGRLHADLRGMRRRPLCIDRYRASSGWRGPALTGGA
jgi:hypothetical protein